MSTKTCMQRVIGRDHRYRMARRPHDAGDDAAGTVSGYASCIHCGAAVYVGRGHMSPEAAQRREHDAARADMTR